MVDTPTARNRFRKQQLGTNTNTWGDTKLNEVLDCVDQALDGVETIDLGAAASYTLITTNYTTADQAKQRVLKFINANASGSSVIIPSVEHEYNCINGAGADVTVTTFAGTGVLIPNGYQARIYCDATNVYNGSPTVLPGAVQVAGKISNLTAGTNATDAVNKVQMETAIANAGIPSSAGTVRNSLNDTTANYLINKIVAAGSLTISTLNPGGNEQLQISFSLDEGQAALYAGVYAL